ncbi:hypothetical protein LAV77_08510 [Priestia megaterium]|uniref:hypothetical protein n=1 Tax=Priestia megaterium TaxID=1404 RepID=UPI002B2446EE|nr:hypothetical protein [Priestia megaterium]MEB2264826.1 hypothetical protein [Priestia megaterium]
MSSYGSLETSLLISVQGFALLSTARSSYIYKTYVHDHHKKIRTSLILHQESNSFG